MGIVKYSLYADNSFSLPWLLYTESLKVTSPHIHFFMRPRTQLAILLLLLPPVLGELLSGSAPPVVFFNPFTFVLLVLLYGCGTLIIRELRVRWSLQWSIVFLAVAYGIMEEGLMVKSFFNPGWVDLGTLSGYGMAFGVQWPWTLTLIAYHATVSTLIPIAILDLLMPELKYRSVVGKRGFIACAAGLIGVTLLGMAFFGTPTADGMIPYYPPSAVLLGAFLCVALLIWLAYRFRENRVQTAGRVLSPWVFGLLAFLFMAANLLIPNALASLGIVPAITVAVQLAGIALVAAVVYFQLLNRNFSIRHIVALVTGSLLFWIMLTPLSEFGMIGNPDPTTGMFLVGIVTLGLLVYWRRVVLGRQG